MLLFALQDLCTACGRTKVQTGRFNVKAKPLNEKVSIINNIANFKQIQLTVHNFGFQDRSRALFFQIAIYIHFVIVNTVSGNDKLWLSLGVLVKINLQSDDQNQFAFCAATNVTVSRLSVRILV